jgi:hypothetical protein
LIDLYLEFLEPAAKGVYLENRRLDIEAFKEKKPWSEYLPKLGQVIRDEDDRVVRCVGCGWEVVNQRCVNCGFFYSAGGDLLGHMEIGGETDGEEAAGRI